MNNQLQSIVLDWIPNQSKVVDFGCGDGTLLKSIGRKKNLQSVMELRLTEKKLMRVSLTVSQ